MSQLPLIDAAILVVYLAVVVGWGCGFVRTATSAEAFMSAGRGLPGWAVGLSVFGSFVSSITFLANPGAAYQGNWNRWVFALSLPIAAWVATKWFVPFFRQSGELSAYHHLEHRFGAWARTYGVVCYLLTQITRLGTILYLLALALHRLVGVDVPTLIVVAGFLVTIYPLFGGTEGVIWTGVVQAIVLVLGAVVCIAELLLMTPGGAEAVFTTGWYEDKFSLGPYTASVSDSTFAVVLIYGLVMNLQNFGIDQSYVQRYLTAESDAAARRSVWMGALCYIPLSAAFLLIGTALFVFYQAQPERLPEGIEADKVFPHFMHTELPVGLRGLVLAAICSAAMDSNLNCCATLYLCDIHRRYFRPQASDRESLWALRLSTVILGALSTGAAIAMIAVKSALDQWWSLAGIFSGGILGLFLLGRLDRAANHLAGFFGTVAGVTVIVWMTVFPRTAEHPGWWRSPFHPFLIIVFGTLTIVAVGMIAEPLSPVSTEPPMTSSHRFLLSAAHVACGFAILSSTARADELIRLKYNHPGLVVDLGVGLWAWPVPGDHDGDGDMDLIVVCPDAPYNGTYLFENPGGDAKHSVFKPARRLSAGSQNVTPSYVDGKLRVMTPAQEYPDFIRTGLEKPIKLPLTANVHPNKVRFNQWKLVDYDGDGRQDLTIGIEDWTDYGWDRAFNDKGEWTRGPLHGHIYLLRNTGGTGKDQYFRAHADRSRRQTSRHVRLSVAELRRF